MKEQTPKGIALLSALIISASLSVLYVLLSVFLSFFDWKHFVGLILISFPLSFLIIQFFIERFIHDKIKLIYKSIHNLKSKKDYEGIKVKMDQDVFKQLDEEVMDWEEERTNELDELRRMEIYRKEFLGNVSHELKTPIFNIQGYVLTLLDGGINDPTINMDYLQRTEKSVERMISIVEDLEAISQLESGQMTIEHEVFDILRLTEEVFKAQDFKAQLKSIRLKFNEEYEKEIYVYADKDRIRQVLTNLVVNSIKYGKDNGSTEVRFYNMDENILVEISDDGIGVKEKHLSRLWERFYRVDKSRSRDQGGTGLGLSIVKHIIEAHHQTINVRSKENLGATFSFTLKKA